MMRIPKGWRTVDFGAADDEELNAADCVIIVTDHSGIDYKRVCSLASLIVDTRNALNGDLRRDSKARIIRLVSVVLGLLVFGRLNELALKVEVKAPMDQDQTRTSCQDAQSNQRCRRAAQLHEGRAHRGRDEEA